MVRGSDEQREYLESIGEGRRRPAPIEVRPPCTSLPEGYTPFRLNGSPLEAPYLTYLRGRGLPDLTVGLYRMGYVDTGFLAGRVVVPSFDLHGQVNFWSARSIDPAETLRYRLPLASKDVVSNEHMVDWTRPVYLVEGIFDEVAIGAQAISLYGKFLLPTLATRLVERRPPMVHICLDSDARMEARVLMRRLLGYDLPCSIVALPGKDPGSTPVDEVTKAAFAARPVRGDISALRAEEIP
jgi:hypothetical protein